MEKYNHKNIEQKWQKHWEKERFGQAVDNDNRPKFYGLIEFPYPSGEGLHVGHVRSNTAMDIICRKRRMQGYNVLYPIGWDAFGLPTENYAIKTGIHPAMVTKKNTDIFRRQLKSLGFSFDWSREINTTDPEYYKWTQWIFLQLFKHGLAYKKKMAINWCPSCKIGLANEEVIDGNCERCGAAVEKRDKEQWMLAITKYADRLDRDLDQVNYLEKIKIQQKNWIGRSEGVNLILPVKDSNIVFEAYDSIPQTHAAQTFVVIAPDHPKLAELVQGTKYEAAVISKAQEIIKKRMAGVYEKTEEMDGIFTGRYIKYEPAKRELPLWVASYVVADYGTGVVSCSVHDERDYAFAKKFNIPLHPVLFPEDRDLAEKVQRLEVFYREPDGILREPAEFKGRRWDEVRQDIIDYLAKKGWARRAVNYKLRDWVFSRQHYWGEPIPMVYCEKCAKEKHYVLLAHGLMGHSRENWFPWFKEVLSEKGYEVIIPDLPDPDEPEIDKWLAALKQAVHGKKGRISVIGHSLGAPAVCQFLIKNKLSIENLILVAPTGVSQGEKQWSKLRAEGVSDRGIEIVKIFNKKNKNLKKIVGLAGRRIIYLSDNDPYIPLEVEKDYAALAAEVKILNNKGHFNHEAGISEFPEILEIFSENSNIGYVPVPEKDLPVELPKVEKYQPTDTGESPLAGITEWVNVKCPKCGSPAKRETDTMPNWAGSSWYYLAYLMRKNSKSEILNTKQILNYKLQITNKNTKSNYLSLASASEQFKYWTPVDWYNGGMEHTTLHLLYSRFWHKFLFDIGAVPTSEPYKKRTSHGMVLAEDGVKMSKSRGNVINPDKIVEQFGADALRAYEMFMGPFDQTIAWSTDGLAGAKRFLDKIWHFYQTVEIFDCGGKGCHQIPAGLKQMMHKTIKKVSEDIENMRFNTAISQMMIFMNFASQFKHMPRPALEMFLQLLAPFAPHLAEELWEKLGNKESIFKKDWPKFDPKLVQDEVINLVLQVNGKVRDLVEVEANISEEEAKKIALESEKIKKWLEGKEVKKVIFVKGKLVNVVV